MRRKSSIYNDVYELFTYGEKPGRNLPHWRPYLSSGSMACLFTCVRNAYNRFDRHQWIKTAASHVQNENSTTQQPNYPKIGSTKSVFMHSRSRRKNPTFLRWAKTGPRSGLCRVTVGRVSRGVLRTFGVGAVVAPGDAADAEKSLRFHAHLSCTSYTAGRHIAAFIMSNKYR